MKDLIIRGQYPRHQWRKNAEGQTRTIAEALIIAQEHGVQIPEDVAFFVDNYALLGDSTTARGPIITKPSRSAVAWSDFVNDLTGKVPFLIRPDIMSSDEAIVAVFAHEMFELEALRPILQRGRTSIEDFIGHTAPGNPGNLHDKAWDEADTLVEVMRRIDQ